MKTTEKETAFFVYCLDISVLKPHVKENNIQAPDKRFTR